MYWFYWVSSFSHGALMGKIVRDVLPMILTLTTFYLGDASGAPFSNGSCTPGSPVNTHIWVQFTPTAASDRYSLHLTFNVKITKPDGSVQSYAVNDCLYEGQPIPTHGLLDIHTFTWNCGDEVELSNFYMAWQSNSGKDCDVTLPNVILSLGHLS